MARSVLYAPVVKKIILSPLTYFERRYNGDDGLDLVEVGQRVRPFDFVLEGGNPKKRVMAGVPGEVVKIRTGQAVLIATEAVIVQGAFGKGEEAEGDIRIATSANEPLRSDQLSPSDRGTLLVCGHIPSREIIKKAEAIGVNGVICGGANSTDLEKISLPVLLTEGFGSVPMAPNVYQFLTDVAGRHAFLLSYQARLLMARQVDHVEDILAKLPKETPDNWEVLKRGTPVQVLGTHGYFGTIGEVVKIKDDWLDIKTESDTITVPARNVGVIR